jgi:glycosyltransferase involved in cell wall biosynthesis
MFVLPGDVDDAEAPSGGNTYDRRTCRALAAAGRPVRELAVPGTWPWPDEDARVRLAHALAALADDALVVLDGLVACGVPDLVVPHARRLRLVVLVHLPLADETGMAPALAAELDARERETLRAATAVVAPSGWAAHRLVEHHGLDPDRVHTVPPGTDPAPLAQGTDGRSRLVCAAAVIPRKGQDLLVEALARVAALPWNCECAGPEHRDPAYAERIRGLIERHGLDGRVRLTGPRPREHVFAAADLVVLPSRAETYGMVVAEALARGIPVLATAVGGVPEALGHAPDGEVPGLLVPPEDPSALADALRRWATEPVLRDRLRASARLRRGTFDDWDATARHWTDVLTGVRHESRSTA